jgi:hypothetical protein
MITATTNLTITDTNETTNSLESTPVFHTDAITVEDAAATKGRNGPVKVIKEFNKFSYIACKKVDGIGVSHVFYATTSDAAEICCLTGIDVYLLDADLDTPLIHRLPVWAAKTSRVGLKVDAEIRPSLEDVGFIW